MPPRKKTPPKKESFFKQTSTLPVYVLVMIGLCLLIIFPVSMVAVSSTAKNSIIKQCNREIKRIKDRQEYRKFGAKQDAIEEYRKIEKVECDNIFCKAGEIGKIIGKEL